MERTVCEDRNLRKPPARKGKFNISDKGFIREKMKLIKFKNNSFEAELELENVYYSNAFKELNKMIKNPELFSYSIKEFLEANGANFLKYRI